MVVSRLNFWWRLSVVITRSSWKTIKSTKVYNLRRWLRVRLVNILWNFLDPWNLLNLLLYVLIYRCSAYHIGCGSASHFYSFLYWAWVWALLGLGIKRYQHSDDVWSDFDFGVGLFDLSLRLSEFSFGCDNG